MPRFARLFAFALCTSLVATAWAAEDVGKVNGSIQAEAGRSYGSLETVNGNIDIDAEARVGPASTVNGYIVLGRGAHADSLTTVNGGIRLERDATVDGSVETVNGGVFVDRGSTIGGDVATVNGAIGLVRTRLGGSVRTVNGNVTVGIGSRVRGGITIERSSSWFQVIPRQRTRVVVGPGAVVEGPVVLHRDVDLLVHRTARTGPVTGGEAVVFDSATAPID